MGNWLAFTIADNADKELLKEVVKSCLDKGVCYACSAGMLAGLTEAHFDEEIVYRAVLEEEATDIPYDYDNSAMTSAHRNFNEGFWFATSVAADGHKVFNNVVCIDLTTQGVKGHLTELIRKINDNWVPSEEENEYPIYDSPSV